MDDMTTTTILRLRERAATCRRLARHATSDTVAAELKKLAQDYDTDVSRLEMLAPDLARAFAQYALPPRTSRYPISN